MKIKICGITNLEDASMCIETGADMLGFNFYKASPRYISIETCKYITKYIKDFYPDIILVGIFVNHSINEINKTIDNCYLDLGQLCGNESYDYYKVLGDKVFKAIRPKNHRDLNELIGKYPIQDSSPNILIDSPAEGSFGGSGQLSNWYLASELARNYDIMLAGGLTPENIREAILSVSPWGVDVASGVEIRPGKKDPIKVAELIRNVRSL